MKRIILDTNFLLIPIEFKVDIFSEIERICNFKYELSIIDRTINELDAIIEYKKGKAKDAARIALQLIKRKRIKKIITKEHKDVDSIIVDVAAKDDIVATQDRVLKQKLKEKGITVMTLRQKKYIIMD